MAWSFGKCNLSLWWRSSQCNVRMTNLNLEWVKKFFKTVKLKWKHITDGNQIIRTMWLELWKEILNQVQSFCLYIEIHHMKFGYFLDRYVVIGNHRWVDFLYKLNFHYAWKSVADFQKSRINFNWFILWKILYMDTKSIFLVVSDRSVVLNW
jgi:hypothetical protein